MNETTITLRGRLTGDPELRFSASGVAVANLTIATNARRFDKQTNEWKYGPATFWRCTAWRELGENAANSLTKGSAVIAVGTVEQRDYETKDGEKRTVFEVTLDALGPDLRWQTARVTLPPHLVQCARCGIIRQARPGSTYCRDCRDVTGSAA